MERPQGADTLLYFPVLSPALERGSSLRHDFGPLGTPPGGPFVALAHLMRFEIK
jgi:hypothetical protein